MEEGEDFWGVERKGERNQSDDDKNKDDDDDDSQKDTTYLLFRWEVHHRHYRDSMGGTS